MSFAKRGKAMLPVRKWVTELLVCRRRHSDALKRRVRTANGTGTRASQRLQTGWQLAFGSGARHKCGDAKDRRGRAYRGAVGMTMMTF